MSENWKAEAIHIASERNITEALKKRAMRRKDIFFSQVKMGSAGSKIIDAMSIKRTWSPVTIEGYEIKISRADFMNDHKYPHYMKTCHLFSFVVPKGITKKDEIPPEVGLIEYSEEKGTLRTVKKAPYRNIDINPEMLLHILFWKMEQFERPMTRDEYFKEYKSRVESHRYGAEVGEKLRVLERKLERVQYGSEWDNLVDVLQRRFGKKFDVYEINNMIPDDPEMVGKCKTILRYVDMLSDKYQKIMKEPDETLEDDKEVDIG